MLGQATERVPFGFTLHNPHSIPILILHGTRDTVRIQTCDPLERKCSIVKQTSSKFAEIRLTLPD